MREIVCSLWLPVGRENFFSPMTDPKLVVQTVRTQSGLATGGVCRTDRFTRIPGYIPHLRESVFRRLLEVLPDSFGYERDGACEFCDEPDENDRAVALTMLLDLEKSRPRLASAASQDEELRAAGITQVTLRVDENGFYTFTAQTVGAADRDVAEQLLRAHIVAVFGDGFAVDRLSMPMKGRHANEGADAVRRYNGLNPLPPNSKGAKTYAEEEQLSPPLGALSFFQLNVMIEAICNQSLLPGVFFEHYADARRWLTDTRGRVSVITHLDDFIDTILVPVDAREIDGQTAALRRFLVISRGTLQWMRRSVDSVRRSLLDQMMAVSHRRARLIQLDLAGIRYERTPELTGEATESQMRGYVVLIGTKLPLIQSVSECAQAAVATLAEQAESSVDSTETVAGARVHDLKRLTERWVRLLGELHGGVRTLADAVSQDWQERLLYEQEQARSEQEAMAEIERSRRGAPDRRRTGELLYQALMLILTVITVVVAIPVVNDPTLPNQSILQRLTLLLPLAPIVGGILVALGAATWHRRFRRQRRPDSEAYGYEFAFRLDEASTGRLIHDQVTRRETLPVALTGFGRTVLRPLGGWRSDKISEDTELVKLHSVAVVRLGLLRYARFEIVVEILIRRISEEPQFFLRHCRVFGDSPRPIELASLRTLVRELVRAACEPMAVDGHLDMDRVTALTDGIYLGLGNGTPSGSAHLQVPAPRSAPDDRVTADRG